MFENIINFFKKMVKKDEKAQATNSKDAAKERLHLVLMQDRANVSVDFLELMKQEIIEVIKKYIEVDEKEIDVRLTNKENEDGTNGAPALYANIPILNIKNEARKIEKKETTNSEEEQEKDDSDKKNIDKKQEVKTENKQEDKEEKSDSNNEKSEKQIKDENKNKEETSKIVSENKEEKELS